MMARERMATPARQLEREDAEQELARLEGYPWHVPADWLRRDALQLRLRELAGERVAWPRLTTCTACHGSGCEMTGFGRWTTMGPCEACAGRGQVAFEITQRSEIRMVPVLAAVEGGR